MIAGPAFNFLFAIAVYAGLFMYGLPEARPIVAEPPSASIAMQAGFHAGDTVLRVDTHAVSTWQELRWRLLQGALQRQALPVEVISSDQKISVLRVDFSGLSGDDIESDLLERLGFRLHRPRLAPVLGGVVSGSAAERAGLKAGDRIVACDERPIGSWEDLVQAIRVKPAQPVLLALDRDGAQMRVEVTPDSVSANGQRIGRIGVSPAVPEEHAEKIFVRVHYGPIDSLMKSVAKTWDISVFSLKMLGRMLVGQLSWKHLSGPVTIADFAGQSAQLFLDKRHQFCQRVFVAVIPGDQ